MNWLRAFGVLGVLVVIGGVAACGGDDDDDDGGAAGKPADAVTVKVATDAKLGAILTGADGLTLYTFTSDQPGKSTCTGGCAATWPPLTTSATSAPPVEGATGEFSVISRPDGAKQIAFNGHPLYRYGADLKAGEVTGEGVGGVWFAARANGAAASTSTDGSSTPAAGGSNPYNY